MKYIQSESNSQKGNQMKKRKSSFLLSEGIPEYNKFHDMLTEEQVNYNKSLSIETNNNVSFTFNTKIKTERRKRSLSLKSEISILNNIYITDDDFSFIKKIKNSDKKSNGGIFN